MDKSFIVFFIIIFSILFLHLHFIGEGPINFIRIVRIFYIPTCLVIYIIETYYLKSIFSLKHTGTFLIGFCFLGIIFNKIKIKFKNNRKYKWLEESIIFNRLLYMFTFMLPFILAASLMNLSQLVLGIP